MLKDSRKCKIREETNLLWPRTKSEQEAGEWRMGQVMGACNYCSATVPHEQWVRDPCTTHRPLGLPSWQLCQVYVSISCLCLSHRTVNSV